MRHSGQLTIDERKTKQSIFEILQGKLNGLIAHFHNDFQLLNYGTLNNSILTLIPLGHNSSGLKILKKAENRFEIFSTLYSLYSGQSKDFVQFLKTRNCHPRIQNSQFRDRRNLSKICILCCYNQNVTGRFMTKCKRPSKVTQSIQNYYQKISDISRQFQMNFVKNR